jgi:hypothetical protein
MSSENSQQLIPGNKTILKWEVGGIVFVFLLGALLHFVFEWSGESRIVGAIASVNESVWEHFKQGFWPMCLYAAIEYRVLRKYTGNFLTAKAIAVYLIPLITGLIFYTYTALVGKEILIVDILIFAFAITVGQLNSYRTMILGAFPNYANRIAFALIIMLALVLIIFTFYPPHLPIFMDHNSGMYGIP